MPESQAEYNLRPRKKRHTSVRRPEGYTVVIRLPRDSSKAFKVSNQAFQDAMLKYYGQEAGKEGCCSKETGSRLEQNALPDGSSSPSGANI